MDTSSLREKVHRAQVRLTALELIYNVVDRMPRSTITPRTQRQILSISRKFLRNDIT